MRREEKEEEEGSEGWMERGEWGRRGRERRDGGMCVFSSRRRHTRASTVWWARRGV